MIDLDRVLVIGGSGMVGSQVLFGIRPSHKEFDISDTDSILQGFEVFKPSAVLHLAGLVDMRIAEENPEETYRINVEGTIHIADACAKANIPLVFFSTCSVFDGSKSSPYDESDTPNPLTVYGETKHKAEQEVLARAPLGLVIRTGWLFGGGKHDTKFVKHFIDALISNKPVNATNNRFGSPTYIPDLIEETKKLLINGEQGIVHIVNKGAVSYFEVAERIKIITNSASSVTGVSAKDIDPSNIKRGSMEALTSNRGIILRPYEEALADYISVLGS